MSLRGNQPANGLHLSHDRKVSPQAIYQASRDRWIPTIPNSFGLPSVDSCPGRTPFCTSCYAIRSENGERVRELVEHNLELLAAGNDETMAQLLIEMLARYRAEADRVGVSERDRIFRIHWDGDFFSLDYASAWAHVCSQFIDVSFWAYTRSFVAPVNVVPILAGIPNLALYLSADPWNIEAAREMVDAYPDVHLAVCAIDYDSAREMAGDRRSIVCPENAEKMPLSSDVGRGACADCRLCVVGRCDVLFSTSHRDSMEPMVLKVGMRGRA